MPQYITLSGQPFTSSPTSSNPPIQLSGSPTSGQVIIATDPTNASWNDLELPTGSVTYQEGGVASNNIFTTFAAALADIQAGGTPITMYIDGSLGQPVVLAGTYDLSLVTLSEMPNQQNVTLNINNNAQFNPAPSHITGGLSIYSYSSVPVIDLTNGQTLNLFMDQGSWLQTAGTAPFIHVGVGATCNVYLSDGAYLAGSLAGSTRPIISADAGSTFTAVNVGNWSNIGAGALDGYGTMEANLVSSSATVDAQASAYNLTNYNANVYPPSASAVYSLFYALMPGDNSATIAANAPVLFPNAGPTNGAATAASSGTFNLPTAGTYHVTWQCSIAEAGQLQVALGGVGVAYTVSGRATGTNYISGDTLVTTSSDNTLLSIINPAGNSPALTMTVSAGGTHAVAATLTIWKL
jgi:hypothetical protein